MYLSLIHKITKCFWGNICCTRRLAEAIRLYVFAYGQVLGVQDFSHNAVFGLGLHFSAYRDWKSTFVIGQKCTGTSIFFLSGWLLLRVPLTNCKQKKKPSNPSKHVQADHCRPASGRKCTSEALAILLHLILSHYLVWLRRDMRFPTMWHFDKCRLRSAWATFFLA